MCSKDGYTTASYVIDHIEPHKGNQELFWDTNNMQALCHNCHAGTKQVIDHRGYALDIGSDGWPKDNNHPVNKR